MNLILDKRLPFTVACAQDDPRLGLLIGREPGIGQHSRDLHPHHSSGIGAGVLRLAETVGHGHPEQGAFSRASVEPQIARPDIAGIRTAIRRAALERLDVASTPDHPLPPSFQVARESCRETTSEQQPVSSQHLVTGNRFPAGHAGKSIDVGPFADTVYRGGGSIPP